MALIPPAWEKRALGWLFKIVSKSESSPTDSRAESDKSNEFRRVVIARIYEASQRAISAGPWIRERLWALITAFAAASTALFAPSKDGTNAYHESL